MPYLSRDGVRLYYEDHGQGLPLLLTHGFAACTRMWQEQVAAFQHAYRLILWDLRGHGQSDSPEDQALYSHEHAVEDMRALLDHLGVAQAVLAGHSLGGFLSLAFHLRYPERVRALILQGCGPGYRNPEARAAWNARVEERARALETQGLAAVGGGSEVRFCQHRSAAGLARAARGILRQVDAQVIDSLPRIAVPTLILVGEGDTPFLQGCRYMATHIPAATYVVLPQAGHGANVEQPEAFNAAVREFLARL
ncbi:MAG: alpha/beta hydrolase [Candidatus Tectimicrobiota bacterium]|nr:MAG: alpha/beta hydrolase [Candidatus Tectomicrobia bacterium]